MKEKCLLFSYIYYSLEFVTLKAKLKIFIVDLELYRLYENLSFIII